MIRVGQACCKFPSAKETSKGSAIHSEKLDVEDVWQVWELQETTKDVNGDGKFGLAGTLPVDSLDTTEDALRDGGFKSVKVITGVSM